MLSIFIPWHKIPPPPQIDHKSNLIPWYKSFLWWRCFRELMVFENKYNPKTCWRTIVKLFMALLVYTNLK
jgi:hypothetical protein